MVLAAEARRSLRNCARFCRSWFSLSGPSGLPDLRAARPGTPCGRYFCYERHFLHSSARPQAAEQGCCQRGRPFAGKRSKARRWFLSGVGLPHRRGDRTARRPRFRQTWTPVNPLICNRTFGRGHICRTVRPLRTGVQGVCHGSHDRSYAHYGRNAFDFRKISRSAPWSAVLGARRAE